MSESANRMWFLLVRLPLDGSYLRVIVSAMKARSRLWSLISWNHAARAIGFKRASTEGSQSRLTHGHKVPGSSAPSTERRKPVQDTRHDTPFYGVDRSEINVLYFVDFIDHGAYAALIVTPNKPPALFSRGPSDWR
jgi:hypothetical protein